MYVSAKSSCKWGLNFPFFLFPTCHNRWFSPFICMWRSKTVFPEAITHLMCARENVLQLCECDSAPFSGHLFLAIVTSIFCFRQSELLFYRITFGPHFQCGHFISKAKLCQKWCSLTHWPGGCFLHTEILISRERFLGRRPEYGLRLKLLCDTVTQSVILKHFIGKRKNWTLKMNLAVLLSVAIVSCCSESAKSAILFFLGNSHGILSFFFQRKELTTEVHTLLRIAWMMMFKALLALPNSANVIATSSSHWLTYLK